MTCPNRNIDFRADLLIALLCIALSGCAAQGASSGSDNSSLQQAMDFNHRAEAAFFKGDYDHALLLYLAALKLDRSIENIEGIAVNQINVARTDAAIGKLPEAQRALDALLSDAELPFPTERLTEAAALRGRLYLEAGDLVAAAQWVHNAEGYCHDRCQLVGSLLLLRAQIALRNKQADQALADANAALSHLKDSAQPTEEANAQRLLGEAWLGKNQPASALACFEKALILDREMGASRKIGLDLLRLGQANQRIGRIDDAHAYYRRAAAVAQAGADDKLATEAKRGLEELTSPAMDHAAPPK